jgi:hypothetical protein
MQEHNEKHSSSASPHVHSRVADTRTHEAVPYHQELLTMVEKFEKSGHRDDGSLSEAFRIAFRNWFHANGRRCATKMEELLQLRLELFHREMDAPSSYECESTIRMLAKCHKLENAEELLDYVYLYAMGKETLSHAAYNAIPGSVCHGFAKHRVYGRCLYASGEDDRTSQGGSQSEAQW